MVALYSTNLEVVGSSPTRVIFILTNYLDSPSCQTLHQEQILKCLKHLCPFGKVRCLGDMRQFEEQTSIDCQILFLNKVKYLAQVRIVGKNT